MITPEYTPVLLVAIPLLGAFLTPLIGRIGASVRNGFVIFVTLINSILVFLFASDVLTEGIKTYVFGAKELTLPIVRILFEVDALSIFMAIISTLLVLVGVIYSWAFVQKSTGQDKYYTLYLLVYAGMMGMVLTGDLFNFFVFLEITSISSAALIAFWTDHAESLEAAFKYIVISALGALFVLLAIALLYGQYDALNIAQLANVIQYSMMDKIALVLLIAALGMKAGLAPMHMWLPDSYGRAPATISLVLVSATLVSLYGVLRVVFTLYGGALSEIVRFDVTMNLFLGWFLIGLAVITILVGVIMALIQSDFKRLIAFSAVAELGYMFLGIGAGLAALGTAYGGTALKGGIFHIFNDALDVGLLFLVAGAVYYATQERSLDKLGGLARSMKYTTIFFIIGLLAVAGMPPLNGYASKLLIYQSTFQLNPILGIIAILCSILLLAVFVKVFYSAFMGPSLSRLGEVKEVPRSMLLGMGIIAAIIIFIGLFPEYFLS
ncbi:MAG: NADH:ubiquinone oxidoreductase, partial [Candidatus Thermoplasmatota archaeon]|nr:NADH:ubiquinone oxidoreductase [Candidatus Thermoplasmatota archaeon]MBU1941357.1 NADH:ubiquinone oxidoreductase [Candidatus Thermoplasmatota archaeon]